MPLLTTTIGAYPKPDYVPVVDWFKHDGGFGSTDKYLKENLALSNRDLQLLDQATQEVVKEQVDSGIDVPTDGEIRRQHYIEYHLRHLQGVDFGTLTKKVMRQGAWIDKVPTITGPIKPQKEHFLIRDWQIAQSSTKNEIKITVPGPITIIDSYADAYYGDEKKLAKALAEALNYEIKALAEAGCKWIQIDEPLFARYPEKALDYGIENLERCFHSVSKTVTRAMHMCCGYPDKLDNENYHKADPNSYFQLAGPLDESSIQAVSIEDAHRHNDLKLLEKFTKTKVIFGSIAIARSRVETVEGITDRLRQALEHIDLERLIVAPDCGLGMLPKEIVKAKLRNMSKAAKKI